MHPVGFEPAVPGNERPPTHALDRAGAGIDTIYSIAYSKTRIVSLSSFVSLHFLRSINIVVILFVCLMMHFPKGKTAGAWILPPTLIQRRGKKKV